MSSLEVGSLFGSLEVGCLFGWYSGGMSVLDRNGKERKALVMSILKIFPLWRDIFPSLSRGLSCRGDLRESSTFEKCREHFHGMNVHVCQAKVYALLIGVSVLEMCTPYLERKTLKEVSRL